MLLQGKRKALHSAIAYPTDFDVALEAKPEDKTLLFDILNFSLYYLQFQQ